MSFEHMDRNKPFKNSLLRKGSHAPRSRDPWKYADIAEHSRAELSRLRETLCELEREHSSELDQYKNEQAAQILLANDPDSETATLQEAQFAVDFEQFFANLQSAYLKKRADAIDVYFNLPRPSQDEENTRPIAVFVENGALVLRLSLHFTVHLKKPLAQAERRRQLRRASKTNRVTMRQQYAQAEEKFQSELQEISGFSPLYSNAIVLIAQAIKNLNDLCESGNGTARIGGITMPVQVELVEVTCGAKPQTGGLNIRLYSQIPEVRSKISFNYNVSHAYLWSAAVPYLGNLLARLGFCSLYLNLMLGTNGEPTAALYKIAIHELLHTLGIQDQYKSRSQKVHPDIADNDIMYTVGENARILDYVFNKILTVTKKLNALS